MSLREAVRVTLEGMEQDSKDADYSPETRALLKAYARELRAAFTAAENESAACVVPHGGDAFRAMDEYAARAERLAQRKKQQLQEQQECDAREVNMVLCVGGRSGGDYIPVQENLVEGNCLRVSGEDYILRNGQLHLIL